MTIDDVAAALSVSKSTVSRAVTGNGRISKVTRRRVLQYMEEHNYRPNLIAQNLVKGCSFNLAFLVPEREELLNTYFFLQCLLGAEAKAAESSNEVILVPTELERVKRLVERRKVDGAILSRSVENDEVMEYLIESKAPFVLIGSTDRDGVTQVDGDHRAAARMLTRMMLERHGLKPALLNGKRTHLVNRARAEGFLDSAPGAEVIWESESRITEALLDLYQTGARLLFAADDAICSLMAHECDKLSLEGVFIASFFSSGALKLFRPDIPTIEFDSALQGSEACAILLRKIDGGVTPKTTLLDYRILIN
ncbi:MAG: LacI family transcriptional regulator [Clostridiales bacterium]|nr:LacI family transcriptional regulator [Clostridiales bacterium]